MEKGLVSVITPCYGTASYLGKLLESVVSQNYGPIEMIVVDDGSPDDIKSVFDLYAPAFKKRGFDFKYIRQENAGQSVAINTALQHVNGEYLVWPDSDDHYASPEAISRMVARFEELGDEYGMVRTQERMITDEAEPKLICTKGLSGKEHESQELFEDCLFHQNDFFYCPGVYMVDFEKFKATTKLPIYTNKDAGQNWQLMLPVLYHFRCSTIVEPLYNVVCRASSHSRSKKSLDAIISRLDTYKNTIVGTLDRIVGMPDAEREAYKVELERRYTLEKLEAAIYQEHKQLAKKYYGWLKVNGGVPYRVKVRYLLMHAGLMSTSRALRNGLRKIGI